jgi:hypothetical protein
MTDEKSKKYDKRAINRERGLGQFSPTEKRHIEVTRTCISFLADMGLITEKEKRVFELRDQGCSHAAIAKATGLYRDGSGVSLCLGRIYSVVDQNIFNIAKGNILDRRWGGSQPEIARLSRGMEAVLEKVSEHEEWLTDLEKKIVDLRLHKKMSWKEIGTTLSIQNAFNPFRDARKRVETNLGRVQIGLSPIMPKTFPPDKQAKLRKINLKNPPDIQKEDHK